MWFWVSSEGICRTFPRFSNWAGWTETSGTPVISFRGQSVKSCNACSKREVWAHHHASCLSINSRCCGPKLSTNLETCILSFQQRSLANDYWTQMVFALGSVRIAKSLQLDLNFIPSKREKHRLSWGPLWHSTSFNHQEQGPTSS